MDTQQIIDMYLKPLESYERFEDVKAWTEELVRKKSFDETVHYRSMHYNSACG